MNNKILICSIIAVAILVLVSFTGVVGYQTTKSSTIARASPLFTVRSSRAIDEESRDLSCDYFGKGLDSNINIPMRDGRQLTIQRFTELVKSMDDDKFDKFTVQLVSLLEKQDVNNIDTIINLIKTIKSDKGRINLFNNVDSGEYTWFVKFHPDECWYPFKVVINIVFLLIIIKYHETYFYSSCPRVCPD